MIPHGATLRLRAVRRNLSPGSLGGIGEMRISRSFRFPNRRFERCVKRARLIKRECVVQRRHGVGPIGLCVMGLDSNVKVFNPHAPRIHSASLTHCRN